MNNRIETEGMPSALMAEKAVLSAMMRQPQKYIAKASADGIDADCFYLRLPMYEVMMEHYRENPAMTEIDMVALMTSIQLSGKLERCGGPSEIADIYNYTYEMFHAWSIWVSQLREAKARRIAYNASKEISEAFTSEEALDALTSATALIKAATSSPTRSKSGKQSVEEFLKQWKTDFESSDAIPGMATGYEEIDAISGGMRAGELWIICAKSTRGKSVMMLEIAALAIWRKETVAIFSLEMMASVVTGRLVSVLGNCDYTPVTQPKLSNKHHRAAIKRGMDEITESKVWIDDTPNQTMAHIEAECQRILDITGELDLIVIDYMQIVKGETRRGESREQEVARISMAGKQMAKKFGVPVLSASQLNAAGEVRESKSLEQDADTLLFIGDDGVKIGKMRNGKRDAILPLYLHGDVQKFLTYKPTS
jgi:replicative DNA helicase